MDTRTSTSPRYRIILLHLFRHELPKIKMFSMKGLGDFKWLQYMSEDQKQRIKKAELLKKEVWKQLNR